VGYRNAGCHVSFDDEDRGLRKLQQSLAGSSAAAADWVLCQ